MHHDPGHRIAPGHTSPDRGASAALGLPAGEILPVSFSTPFHYPNLLGYIVIVVAQLTCCGTEVPVEKKLK